MDPHNEELSPAAQALLAQHRDARSPDQEQSARVWDRVQHSVFVAPLGLEQVEPVEPEAPGVEPAGSNLTPGVGQAAGDAGNAAGSFLAPGTELLAAGSAGASSGLLGGTALKWTLGALLVGGGTTTALVAQEQIIDTYAPTAQVQPIKPPAPLRTPGERSPATIQNKAKLPMQPPLVPAPVNLSTKMDKRPTATNEPPPLELTPALAAQLRALSEIDALIRSSSMSRAQQKIRSFEQEYANSPFGGDLRVLKMVLSCRSGDQVPTSMVKMMLQDPRYRRYRARLARACQE